MPGKEYSVFFNKGQDVMFTKNIEYETLTVDNVKIIMLRFMWNGDNILMPLHNVTYLKESSFHG